ncbi:MAG: hypothetical protein ABSD56_01595 [Bryobacteraceae bacterium]
MRTVLEVRQQNTGCQRRLRRLRADLDRRGGLLSLAAFWLTARVLQDPLVREYLELAYIHFDLSGPDGLMHSSFPR